MSTVVYTKDNIPKSGTPGRKVMPKGYEKDYPHPTPENVETLPYTWYIKSFQTWDIFKELAPDVPKQDWHDRQQYLLDEDYKKLAESFWNDIEASIKKFGSKKIASNKTGENPTIVYGQGGPVSDFQSHKVSVPKKGGVAVVDVKTAVQSTEQQSLESGNIGISQFDTNQTNAQSAYQSNDTNIVSNVSIGFGSSSSNQSFANGITQNSEGRFQGTLDVSRFNTKIPGKRNKQGFVKWGRYA